ncbi:phosphopantetheine-binding protein [Pantoea ananatis]|uniref:phosphopantetheine-binding protein n=1 Tax=Pantoea ananas TaxID=553 RepID=UPI0022212253|nr:phosphopantetheine-binding protein [Pantoea ananatis]
MRSDGDVEPRIVAYVVPAPGRTVDPRSLREALATRLPDYMLPAAFVALDSIRGAAAAGERRGPGRLCGTGDRRRVRDRREVLGIERIGRDDHFFELGGHSLMIVGLVELLREKGIALDVQAVFAAPRLAELAAHATATVAGAPADAPPNPLEADAQRIVPELLPLVDVTRAILPGVGLPSCVSDQESDSG